jgi:hypothetical protein
MEEIRERMMEYMFCGYLLAAMGMLKLGLCDTFYQQKVAPLHFESGNRIKYCSRTRDAKVLAALRRPEHKH